ncbi:MAG: alpha/beta fold hydrolase [Luteolibacter sp.]
MKGWSPVVFFALFSSVLAQQPEVSPAELRKLRDQILSDSDGSAAREVEKALGKNGGNRLFYFPTRDEPETPSGWGFSYEAVDFKSSDGTPLHGWFIPGKAKEKKGTVVFSHGNSGSMGYHLGFILWMADAGYNVLMYDYRGFGKSGGSPDRRGILNDVKAAFAYVKTRKDVDPTKLVSYGHSLGGAKSVTALAETPVKGVRAIVIDGAFASYISMARFIGGQLGEQLVSDEWAPKDFVKRLAPTPLLVVHGTVDEVVPFSQGRQLYERAGEPKTLFAVKGGHHGDSLYQNHGAYRKKMLDWLDQALKG